MQKFTVINKKEGETPLVALERLRRRFGLGKDVPMTYAGRLDPMASGLLIILLGEETKKKENYLALDKEYEFEVLFGFASDTYDILGKVVKSGNFNGTKLELEKKIKSVLGNFTGNFTQEYPMYSSKTVNGKPLFEYGREGIRVEVPVHEISVKNIKLLKIRKSKSAALLSSINKRISGVVGDFRQKDILKMWNKVLSEDGGFFVVSFKIACSSGTYVRGISNSLGEQIGIPALAYSIKRTKIGKFARISR